jgi:hypothetical protein
MNLPCWKIEEKQKRVAIWRAAPHIHIGLYQATPPAIPGAKMEVTGVFFPSRRKLNLGSHRFSEVPRSASEALSDDEFVSKLFEKIARRGAELASLEEVLLYDKKSSEFLKLPWDTIEDFSLELELQKGCSGARTEPPTALLG